VTWFFYAIIGAFFGSLSTIVEKKTLERVHATDFAVALSFVAALITLPVLFLKPWTGVTPLLLGGIALNAILAATAYLLVTKSMRHMLISVSSPLLLLSPFATALLAYVFLHEALSRFQIIGIGMIIVGLYILETDRLARWRDFFAHLFGSKYSLYTLVGVVLYAFAALIDRTILGYLHIDPLLYLALAQLCVAVNMAVIAHVFRGRNFTSSIRTVGFDLRWVVIIALFTSAYRLLEAYAMALAAAGLVIAVKRSAVLFTTVIGGELFRDDHLLRKSVACAVMISGVYLLALA
jgi:drug/metabolite transporter (DMT)-like permease